MIRVILWVCGGLAWTFLFLIVGLYVTFPQRPLEERVEYESVRFSDKQFALTTQSIRPWWLGLRGSDVTVYGLKKGRKTKDVPKPPYERKEIMRLDSLAVRMEPVSYVLGKKAATYAATLLGGGITGRYAEGESTVELSFDVEDLDLARLAGDSAGDVLHLLGTLAGDADLRFDTADPKQSAGSLHLAINGLGIGAGSKAGGFGLPEASFEKATLTAEIQDGKLEITEGVFEGSVISAALTGEVTLNKRLSRSRNRLDLAFSLPEEYDQLAQLAPTLKRSKDEEGRYHCTVSGTVFTPSFRCGTRSGRASSLGSGSDRSLINRDPVDDEERRKEREERIKERRERLKKRREEAGLEDPRPLDEEPRRPFGGALDPEPPLPDLRGPEAEAPVDRLPGELLDEVPAGEDPPEE